MKPTTRRSVIAGTVLGVFAAANASYAEGLGRERAPGQLKKLPTPTGAGGVSFGTATSTPTPLADPTFTATPTHAASATSTLVRSPAPTKTPTPRATATGFDWSGEERQLVDLINGSRAGVGSPPLAWHQTVADVMRWRCQDMEARHFSAHQIPAGACYAGRCWSTPIYMWDVLTAIGVPWSHVSENLWQSPLLYENFAEEANRVFLGSESHRNAMLEPVFNYAGTGMWAYTHTHGAHVTEGFIALADTSAQSAQAFTIETTRSADGRLSQAKAKRR